MELNLNLLYYIRNNWHRIGDEERKLIDFFGTVLTRMEDTHSQCFQDLWVLSETSFRNSQGELFYVDIGASDGKTINNTYALQMDRGWSGIVVEPNIVWHEALHTNRHICDDTSVFAPQFSTMAVHTESHKKMKLLCPTESDLSTLEGYGNDEHSEKRKNAASIEVETITLYDLLKLKNAPKEINYVSMDVEGAEYDILEKFFQENDTYTVELWTIEHNYIPETRRKIFDLMTGNGYKISLERFPSCDDFYIKRT